MPRLNLSTECVPANERRAQFNVAGITAGELAHLDTVCTAEGVDSRSRAIRLLIARAYRETTAPATPQEEKPL